MFIFILKYKLNFVLLKYNQLFYTCTIYAISRHSVMRKIEKKQGKKE